VSGGPATPDGPRRKPRAARRDALLRRLLEACETLTADGSSFNDLSVDALVEQVGISRTTFYVYFEDKAELLRDLMADALRELGDSAAGWWTLELPTTPDKIRSSMRETLETYLRHEAVFVAMVHATVSDPDVDGDFQRLIALYRDAIEQHIVAGQGLGLVRAELPARETATFLTWMSERTFYQYARFLDDDEAVERAIDALTLIVWNTLYVEGTPT
jgi:AcrR family transcriptional regulator